MPIQDNSNGTKAQSRTFTDLLQTPYDEDVFEYYATSQLVQVHVRAVNDRVIIQHALFELFFYRFWVLVFLLRVFVGAMLRSTLLYCSHTNTDETHAKETPPKKHPPAQVPSGTVTPLSIPRMYTGISASPDERYLLVYWIERPFSFMVPCGRFPKRVQLWDRYDAHVVLVRCTAVCVTACHW